MLLYVYIGVENESHSTPGSDLETSSYQIPKVTSFVAVNRCIKEDSASVQQVTAYFPVQVDATEVATMPGHFSLLHCRFPPQPSFRRSSCLQPLHWALDGGWRQDVSSSREQGPHLVCGAPCPPVPFLHMDFEGPSVLVCNPFMAHDPFKLAILQAPNICIGGSGTEAGYSLSSQCAVFLVSFAAFLLLTLGALLTRPLRGAFCRCFRRSSDGKAGFAFLTALQIASPTQPVLSWHGPGPCPKHKRRCPTPRSGGVKHALWRALVLCLDFSVPDPVLGLHIASAWVFFPVGASAMTRAPAPGDPPGISYSTRQVYLTPPEELTTCVGICPDVSLGELWEDVEDSCLRHMPMATDNESWVPEASLGECGSDWLGVYVYTPHYMTQQVAVKPAERTMQAVAKILHMHAPLNAGPAFDTIIPTRPQRFEGFLSVVRFSSSIRCPGAGGQVAILFDLTRVGGSFFASILPREIQLSALLEYVRPLTSCRDEILDVFVGCSSRPWPSCEVVDLRDGDTVTVLRQPAGTFARRQAEVLFYEKAFWDHPHNMARLLYHESICVLFRNRRFSLPMQYRTDQNLVTYVSNCLQVDPSCTLMCSFPIKDLDVQGELSTFVIAVAEVPSPAVTGVDRSHTRDLFVLIDPRPLGVKPHFLLLHHPSVHLPAVIALLGLSTPAAMRVGVHGGEREGDDIRIQGNATLRLFAEEPPDPPTPEDTSESSSSGQAEAHLSSDSPERGPASGHAPEGCLDFECDLAAGYANWGEQPDPPPLSASLLDSTLPAGHSWNIGATEGEHPAPDNGTEPPIPEDQNMEVEGPAAAPSSLLNALVYIPDYVPEVLEVRVDLPMGIRDFFDVVQQLRFDDQVVAFPRLCPAKPQPLREMAIFVAVPTWLTDLVVVLLDCRLVQSGFFARTIPSRLNRESILVAAGFRHDDAISVHIEGRIRPLGIDERVVLTHGHTIHFVPRYGDVPMCFELDDMLLSSQGWDPDAPMPGIQSHLNSHFLILSDAGPFTLEITPRSFADFKGTLAEAVGVAEHRLYTKVSVPQIKDSYRFGFWASVVIVATDRLSSIPCPPAARPESRRLLILDQRRILRGFAWQTVEGCFVDVQLLADAYYDVCPLSHIVTFKGGTVVQRDGQRVFSIVNGQVITVEFTREQDPSSSDGDQPPNLSPPPDASDRTGDNEPDTDGENHVGRRTSGVAQGQSLMRLSARSRSPRQRACTQGPSLVEQVKRHGKSIVTGRLPVHLLQTGLRNLGVQMDAPGLAKFAGVRVNKWSLALKEHAHVVGRPGLTPFPWTHVHPDHHTRVFSLQDCFSAFRTAANLSVQGSMGFLSCKLLREPTSGVSGGSGGLDRAREATRLLGGPWPFPPYRWPILIQEDEADPMHIDTDERFTVDISVYLLTPDYTAEHLPLTVQLPQTVQEIEELVQTCREANRRVLFPTLIEVSPQPDPGWGIFLAVPAWASQRAVICCDLSFFDGRIIAVCVSPLTASFGLCASVGLAPRAEVDIYLPGAAAPLPPGGEVFLQSGTCVAFVRPGARRHVTFDLQLMLRSHLGWEHSPVFPHATLDCDGYCVASNAGQFLFRMLPNRAMYYTALTLRCSPDCIRPG